MKKKVKTDICCGILEQMNLGWMKLEDGTKCMPFIRGISDGNNMYRVNYCPSCGKDIREAVVTLRNLKNAYGLPSVGV